MVVRALLILGIAAAAFGLLGLADLGGMPSVRTDRIPWVDSEDRQSDDHRGNTPETGTSADQAPGGTGPVAPGGPSEQPKFDSGEYIPSRLEVHEYRPSSIDPPTYLPSQLTPVS